MIRRKYFRRGLALLLCAAVLVVSLSALAGCNKRFSTKDVDKMLDAENLASSAGISTENGKKLPYSDENQGTIDFVFDREQTFNTIALSEASDTVNSFEIQVKTNGEWTKIYRQDFIRDLRYCVFSDVTASELRILFNASGKFKISDVGIYYVPKSDREFHTVSYLTCDSFQDYEGYDDFSGIESFTGVTDVILFGGIELFSDGHIEVAPKFYTALDNLRRVETELGKRFTVYGNVLNSGTEKEQLGNSETSDQYLSAMKNNRAKLIGQLTEFLNDSGIDGIGFDWEFLYKRSSANVFADFLSELRAALKPDQKLTAAFAGWDAALPKRGIEALDLLQIMSYDLPDDTGNHASFLQSLRDAEKFSKRGIPKEKLCLGIPFYARETVGDAQWFSYWKDAETLGRENNYTDVPIGNYEGGRYYNSYLMVRDKVAYAYDFGAGGVMFWEHGSDCSYDLKVDGEYVSLLRATEEALSFRK